MTPKEKAIELLKMFIPYAYSDAQDNQAPDAKQCALLCVESHIYSENDSPFSNVFSWQANNDYWRDVKTELTNLELLHSNEITNRITDFDTNTPL